MSKVQLGLGYYPYASVGKPLANGSLYVGEIDTDPTIVANQKTVTALQEDGSEITLSQPVSLSAGGVPVYNGSPVSLYVDGSYSIKVLDSVGAQAYYVPRNDSVSTFVKSIATLSDLQGEVFSNGATVFVKGREAFSDRLGDIYVFNEADLSTEVSGDSEMGEYVAPTSDPTGASGAWAKKKRTFLTPEDFGAIGDGTNDDSDAIIAAATKGVAVLDPSKTYKITKDLQIDATQSVIIHGNGAKLNVVSGELHRAIYVNPQNDIEQCVIEGLYIEGNGVLAEGVFVNNTFAIEHIDISRNTINDLDNVTTSRSVSGVYVKADEAGTINIEHNLISNVTRTQVDPGVIASVGIHVTGLKKSANISNNIINSVQSPVGDDDADGIIIFSANRLLATAQDTNIIISGNYMLECKGRFVKLQTSQAHVYRNFFKTQTADIVTSFRVIDCQFGGNIIENNYYAMMNVTGGTDAYFVQTTPKSTGNVESRTLVTNNFVYLERELRYFVLGFMTAGVAHIEVNNNYVKGETSADYLTDGFVRFGSDDVTPLTSANVEINSNRYLCNRDSILQLVGDDFSGDSYTADILSVQMIENHNTVTPGVIEDRLVTVAATDVTPYLENVIIRDNHSGGDHRVDSKSIDLNTLKEGNEFYFGTDGSTGGMANAPTGYDRFVHVKTNGDEQHLAFSSWTTFAARLRSSAQWYEYTGSAL